MNYISGKPPELVLFNDSGEEIARDTVGGKSVDDVRGMLLTYGFAENVEGAKADL